MSDWPILDPAALYGIAGEVVETLLPHTESDAAGLLGVFLAFAGASIGPAPHAMADGARHPGRLFVVLTGSTADGRKGTATGQIRRVFEVADPGFERTRALGGFGSGEILVDAVRDASGENDPGVDDKRLLVLEAEYARVFKVAARDGSTLSPTIRDAYDGGRLQARSRQLTSVATGAHICVVGNITSEELRKVLSETEIAAGLGNRHLFVLVRRSKRLPEGGDLADSDVYMLGSRVRDRLERAGTIGRLTRTPAARELWAEIYGQVADEAARGGEGLVGALTARAEAQLLRMSVLYAALDGAHHIDVQHITAATAFWSYCKASVEYIFAGSLGDQVADKLLAALRSKAPAGMDGTAMHALLGNNIAGKRIRDARSLLVDLGLAELVRTPSGTSGGRPRDVLFATAVSSVTSVSSSPPTSSTPQIHNEYNEETQGREIHLYELNELTEETSIDLDNPVEPAWFADEARDLAALPDDDEAAA